MNSFRRSYLFGAALLAFGCYQLYKSDRLEFSLYALAGLTFIVNALPYEPSLIKYKKPLEIAAWALIFATAILFLYLLQFKFA